MVHTLDGSHHVRVGCNDVLADNRDRFGHMKVHYIPGFGRLGVHVVVEGELDLGVVL